MKGVKYHMTCEEIRELLKKDNLIRGYVYPYEGLRRKYLLEHSPSNIANFIMQHPEAQKIILTDVLDNKILNTMGCFIDRCPDQALLPQILEHLLPMQTGQKEPMDILVASDEELDAFYEMPDIIDDEPSSASLRQSIPDDTGVITFRLVSPLNISVFDPEKGEYDHTLMPGRNPPTRKNQPRHRAEPGRRNAGQAHGLLVRLRSCQEKDHQPQTIR